MKFGKVFLTTQEATNNIQAFLEWKEGLDKDKQLLIDNWLLRLELNAGKSFGPSSAIELLAQVMLQILKTMRPQ